MAVTQYIGARYITKFADPIEHSPEKSYEPLTVVQYHGDSYVSKQFVPVGIAINDTNYWLHWADYNAQVDMYRQEVQRVADDVDALSGTVETLDTAVDGVVSDVETITTQIAGTSESGLKALIEANTESINSQAAQIAGTSDSGLKELISENTGYINALESQMAGTTDSGLLDLINAEMYKQTTNVMKGAKCVGRYETDLEIHTQGGVYFKNSGRKYYAFAQILSGQTATRVHILDLETNEIVKTISGSFAHGNVINYANNKLYVGGAEDSNTFVEIDVSNIAAAYITQTFNLVSLGFDHVWSFGPYKDGKWWASQNNVDIYEVSEDLTTRTYLCSQPVDSDMVGVQQGISYDFDSDRFVSCRTSSITIFNTEGLIQNYQLDWQYGYVFTDEIQEATFSDGKLWFHNNPLYTPPAGFTDYKKVYAVFCYDPRDMSTEPYVNIMGARTIHINSTYPTIPSFVSTVPDYFHYPMDALAMMLAHPEANRILALDNDCPFVVVVPPCVNSVNLNSHGVGGVALVNGADVYLTGNVPYDSTTYADELAMLTTTSNERKVLCSGRGNLFTFFGPSPTEDVVWIYNGYAGAAIATTAKLAFVRGTLAKLEI